jgi:hypothetical protein
VCGHGLRARGTDRRMVHKTEKEEKKKRRKKEALKRKDLHHIIIEGNSLEDQVSNSL